MIGSINLLGVVQEGSGAKDHGEMEASCHQNKQRKKQSRKIIETFQIVEEKKMKKEVATSQAREEAVH